MDRATAYAVLGLEVGAEPESVRRAYRRLVRRHHPDVAGGDDGARVRSIIEAYRTVAADEPLTVPDGPNDDAPAPVATAAVATALDDTVAVSLPPEEAFLLLLDVVQRFGEITYVDPDSALFEAVVEFAGGEACSVVVTLQGRATGVTDAFCTCEAVAGRGAAPPASAVAQWLAAETNAADRLRATS